MEKIEHKRGSVTLNVNYNHTTTHSLEYNTYCELSTNFRYILRLNLNKVNKNRVNNNGETIIFILKNPSDADCNTKDKTLTRLAGWTYHPIKNIHNFTICNLFPIKAKKSYELKKNWLNLTEEEKKSILEENDFKIKQCLIKHEKIILGWGEHKPLHKKEYDARVKKVLEFEEIKKEELFKVGKCLKEEYPKHPLGMWSYKTEKENFDREKALAQLNGKYN